MAVVMILVCRWAAGAWCSGCSDDSCLQVGSRRVVQWSAIFMIVLGIFTKFGAIFVSIPEPVIGASFFILFG